jgi:4'-phosphopantetheinyl transferase
MSEVTVQLWRLSLDLGSAAIATLHDTLSAEEARRAARFTRPRDANRFVAARGQLRTIIGGISEVAPEALSLTFGPFGKPRLQGRSNPRFNLSHAGNRALLAVVAGREVGVDLEVPRPGLESARLARRALAPDEILALDALPADEQDAAFLRCWTRKEAYLKARGDGLHASLGGFSVSLGEDEAPVLGSARMPGEVGRWTLVDLSRLCDCGTAALCIEGRRLRPRIVVHEAATGAEAS